LFEGFEKRAKIDGAGRAQFHQHIDRTGRFEGIDKLRTMREAEDDPVAQHEFEGRKEIAATASR